MSIGEKLKETYFNWEEKWYSFLDKLDEHLPVYKVVDKVDNVVPSFALLLILIFIIFLLLILTTFGAVFAGQSTLKLMVVDNAGNPVSAAQVEIEGIDDVYYSNDFGILSDITLPSGYSILVKASKGDKQKSQTIYLDSLVVNEQIVLPVDLISFSSRTLQFVNETNALITDELSLAFSCSSGATPPQNRVIYNGTINLDQPSNCGTLLLTITSPLYQTKTISITNASTTIILERSIPSETGRAIIDLKFNNEFITENVRVSAYKATNRYIAEDTITSVNGSAVFDLPIGDYVFETKAELGYISKASEVVNVNKLNDARTTINMDKSVLGKINVVVKRGTVPLEDVHVTIRKENSAIDNDTTNSDGNVSFELAQTGPFIIVATKDGYCEQATTANLGDTVAINMSLDNGNCGGELKIRVVDTTGKPVQYAKALIFAETIEDEYKLDYASKTVDFNGKASWNPVKYSTDNIKYKIFAYKGSYSGWSTPREFNSFNQNQEIIVTLGLEDGIVNVTVKDRDNVAVQFAEVQLYEDYANTKVTGKRIIQEANGIISFNVRAGQRVYAVVEKEGYETYTTMPVPVIGNGSINFEVTLARPPIEELLVEFVGLYKNDKKVLKAQPGEEYVAVFELTAPKEYDELGFFVRVGEETVSKTEMDKIYIKELVIPGVHTPLKGSSFNPPKGYNIDQDYLNLEESKWASATWDKFGYAPGKIRVGAIVKIKQNARLEDLIEIGYRAWGEDFGYERDPFDSILGTTESNSNKQALYAITKKAYAWIGTETLCETVGDNSFCVSATYTDSDGIRNSFENSFDAKNNSEYTLGIKVSNASILNFVNTSTKLENVEENILIGEYSLIAPNNNVTTANINGYQTPWISLGEFRRDTEFAFNGLKVTPQKTGFGSLLLRLRNSDTILYEKTFGINIASDKKMRVEYLFDNEYTENLPTIASGKLQTITLKAINVANGLEINGALVKVFDRFGTKIYETTTNSLGIATIQIPASLPGEKLRINVEKPEFETKIIEFRISEDIVNITPTNLSFTVNPQTKVEDVKTVKIENKTGFDLKIQKIEFSGKTKGLISTARMESWFSNYVGTTIMSNDYEDIDFKVISAPVIPTAGDVEGVFLVTVGNDAYSWVQEVNAKIRVGLGSDVDNTNCLEITQNNWKTETQGQEVEISFEVRNNCTVEGQLVPLKNLGAMLTPSGNITGKFSAQSTSAYTELSRGFARTFKPNVNPSEVVPVTIKFTPYGGTTGTTSGTITFQAINPTDSTDQILQTTIDYEIDIVNSSCIVIGSDLIHIGEGETGSFSVTNNCTVSASFQVQSDLALSNSIFNLSAGASQDVTIQRNEGDIPGAYNNLVRARLGTGRQELIGNVKVILDPSADSCFTLTRYEYDVFDSPYSEFDGVDRGYLRNSCTQKPVPVAVFGDEGFDWDKVLRDMLVGAVAGGISSGKLHPWCDGWFCSDNLSTATNETKENIKNSVNADLTKHNEEVSKEIDRYTNDIINAKVKELKEEYNKCNLAVDEHAETLIGSRIEQVKATLKEKCKENYEIKATELANEVAKIDKSAAEKVRAELIKDTSITIKLDSKTKSAHDEYIAEIKKIQETSNQKLNEFEKQKQARIKEGQYSFDQLEKDIEPLREELKKEINEKGKVAVDNFNKKSKTINDKIKTIEFGTVNLDISGFRYPASGSVSPPSVDIMIAPKAPVVDAKINQPADEDNIEIKTQNNNQEFVSFIKKINWYTENTINNTNLSGNGPYVIGNEVWTKDGQNWKTTVSGQTYLFDSTGNQISGSFLLATPRMQEQSSGFNLTNALTYNIVNAGVGSMGGSALGGALLTGVLSMLMGQDNTVQYSETFAVPLLSDISVSLSSNGNVSMSVGDVTYDYDQYYQNLTQRTQSGASYYNGPQNQQGYTQGQQTTTANNSSGQGLTQRSNSMIFNPQALTATLGLVEVRELEFRNGGVNNPNPYEPFVGIITVTGLEKIYENDYKYEDIKKAAKERDEFKENKGNFFEEIFNPTPKLIASITEEDLVVKETRDYKKEFRVLFNSYEYVECGPNTYPCAPVEFASCTVGSKSGITGLEAVPRLLLNWNYSDISAEECDETNPNYSYCDVTQATISTLKKVNYLKDFFNQNSLSECPTAIDNLGTKSQSLNTNTIDVGITNIRVKEVNGQYEVEVVVRTNNSQELGATVKVDIKRDGTTVQNIEQTKTFTSDATYNLAINNNIGSGRFDIVATIDIDLCTGCQNNDISNDSITSGLIIGASGVQECQSYDTRKDSFEKVLSANNINDSRVLEYINFTINLTRDSFSEDFKKDLDSYLMNIAVAPTSYVQNLRELFLSEKFKVDYSNKPGAWRAGKYNARLVIEFNNETWQWNDNNDIKSITLFLEYWGDPVPYNPIYNVSFNGMVGLNTDNGRQGYGSSYNQLSERAFLITEGANVVSATPNPISNTPTRVNVSVDNSFYNMNFTRTGNVLTVQRIGEDVDLVLSPSIAVPLILNINRENALDAYAYYSVEVDGQPQNSGSRFLNWTGIGQGCVAHDGSSMTTWVNSPDSKNPSGDGYGLRWNNAVASGTSSFYGVFYVPETSAAILKIMSQSESASFNSTHGNGPQIVVDSGNGIRNLKDVFDAVRNEEICVIGGEYFWNNSVVIEDLKGQIASIENTCMTIS